MSMSHGYLQYLFAAVFILSLCHCSSARQPESHSEIFLLHFICTCSIKKAKRKILPFSEACSSYSSPRFMKSIVVHLPQLLPFRAISAEVDLHLFASLHLFKDAGILWKWGLVTLSFSLQSVFAFRLHNF